MDYTFKIILSILIFGSLGGIVNYLGMLTDKPKKVVLKVIDIQLLKSVFLGVTAAFLVPLFLNMISSNIVNEAKIDNMKMFVFNGFCLIAAISSKSFIQTLSQKVLGKVEKLDANLQELKRNTDPIIQKQTEGDQFATEPQANERGFTAPPSDGSGQKSVPLFDDSDTPAVKVLKGIMNSKYTFRSRSGLASDTGLSLSQVTHILNMLIKNGSVSQIMRDRGVMFYMTEAGRIKMHEYGTTGDASLFS